MKTFRCESNIGDGLFSDEAVPIELSFPDGSTSEWEVYALTPRRVLALRKQGVKFENHKDDEEAIKHSEAIIASIVKRGNHKGVEIDETNRHNIVGNLGLTAALINAARMLAEERAEDEAKNSES